MAVAHQMSAGRAMGRSDGTCSEGKNISGLATAFVAALLAGELPLAGGALRPAAAPDAPVRSTPCPLVALSWAVVAGAPGSLPGCTSAAAVCSAARKPGVNATLTSSRYRQQRRAPLHRLLGFNYFTSANHLSKAGLCRKAGLFRKAGNAKTDIGPALLRVVTKRESQFRG